MWDCSRYRCNRTVNYQSRASRQGILDIPRTPHNIIKTDATDWSLDGVKKVYQDEGVAYKLPSAALIARRKEQARQRLQTYRALCGPPTYGTSLVPEEKISGGITIAEMIAEAKRMRVTANLLLDRLFPVLALCQYLMTIDSFLTLCCVNMVTSPIQCTTFTMNYDVQ